MADLRYQGRDLALHLVFGSYDTVLDVLHLLPVPVELRQLCRISVAGSDEPLVGGAGQRGRQPVLVEHIGLA